MQKCVLRIQDGSAEMQESNKNLHLQFYSIAIYFYSSKTNNAFKTLSITQNINFENFPNG